LHPLVETFNLGTMTTFSFVRIAIPALLACCILIAPISAQERASIKRKVNIPPSADLSYSIKATQSGLPLSGDARLKWRAEDKQFMVAMETRAMVVGKILDAKSEGAIDEYGLAPVSFTEKRFRKDPTITTFDRQTKAISFSASSDTYPLVGGEQDRSSAIWQLISIARAAQGKFKPGSEWTFFVAGEHDAEPWIFKIMTPDNIKTPLGELHAVHIVKAPPPGSKGQQLDIWLAPSLEWYPVRLRFSEENGDVIEQTLVTISKTPD
jgi:hypothetical protein